MPQDNHSPASTTIGFVGLGIMGEPMARNLLAAGYTVRAHNRSAAPADRLAEEGAVRAASPADAAEGADLVITMLPDSPDVEEVVRGQDGLASGMASGSTLVDMSTIAPGVTRALADGLRTQGVSMLDAPVSGGQQGAIDGALSIMVGGDEATFEVARPILEVLGKNVTLIGAIGAGQIAKACNQVIVGGTIQIVGEALTLAARSGADPSRVRDALLGGFAGSKILEVHGQRMLDENYTPGFKVRLHNKDLRIALETAADAQVPLLSAALVRQLFTALEAGGHGEADHSALALLAGQLSGANGED